MSNLKSIIRKAREQVLYLILQDSTTTGSSSSNNNNSSYGGYASYNSILKILNLNQHVVDDDGDIIYGHHNNKRGGHPPLPLVQQSNENTNHNKRHRRVLDSSSSSSDDGFGFGGFDDDESIDGESSDDDTHKDGNATVTGTATKGNPKRGDAGAAAASTDHATTAAVSTTTLSPAERQALLNEAKTHNIACRKGFDSSEDVYQEYFGLNKNPKIPGGISSLCKEFKSNWYGKAQGKRGKKKDVNGIKLATVKMVAIVLTIKSQHNEGKTLHDVFRMFDSVCKPSEEDGKRHLNTLYDALDTEKLLVRLGPNGKYP